MDELKLQNAQAAYAILCESMDALEWSYSKKDDLVIECGAKGEDLPMDLIIRCDVDLQLLQLFSHLPFAIEEDKRLDVAVAISVINNLLVDGCFDYDISNGDIFFRMTNSFMDTKPGFETIKYFIFCSCATIDSYNDKLLMMSKGILSLEQFLQSEMKGE